MRRKSGERIEGYRDSQRQTERKPTGGEKMRSVCAQTFHLCVLTWEYTRERSEREDDTGRQGCKSKKARTKRRTECDGGAVWVRWL